MNQTLVVALGIIVACNVGTLLLYWKIYQWTRTPAEIYMLMWEIKKQLTRFARNTDYDFRAVKTRMADEERDDRRRKRMRRTSPPIMKPNKVPGDRIEKTG